MAKKIKRKTEKTKGETQGLILLALSFLLFISLMSFELHEAYHNWLGPVGYFVGFGFEYMFGLASFLIPIYLAWISICILRYRKSLASEYDHLHFTIVLICSCFLLTVIAEEFPHQLRFLENKVISETVTFTSPYPRTLFRSNLGGVPFYFLFADCPQINLQRLLSSIGTIFLFASLGSISFFLLTGIQITAWMRKLKVAILAIASFALYLVRQMKKAKLPSLPTKPKIITPEIKINRSDERKLDMPIIRKASEPPVKLEKAISSTKEKIPIPSKQLIVKADSSFKLPQANLLSNPSNKVDQPTLTKDLMRQAAILEETLKSFGIEAKVGEINSGPTITSFEIHPSIGVKVQKIKALENDIALNMEAKSIRIVAPIPGKAAVGVEVPAIHPQEVNFKEMLLYYQQKSKKLSIPILLGKAVNGDWVFADLAKMPHLLIAGATGSGKSVCINTIVMSILMNARPEEIKLLMIDPKKVELTQYSQLPHMIAPVISEPHGAYAALQWLVKEMQVRYEILKQLGLRNVTAFNGRKINKEFEGTLNIVVPEQMPLIVAIVDEFADLMMVSSADLETPIARIAQMARAVGIHLILATQRPSREVITGIIKANIPTRISFKVASRINSQIILDEIGAESLLGNGDLLFLPPGSSQLMRAQGAYISDEEINQVVQFLSSQGPPNYLISSFDSFRSLDLGTDSDAPKGKDSLYDQALNIVLNSKNASTTFLQRKLKIGYARAASLIDELEENGVVSAPDGSKARRVISSSLTPSLSDDDEIS